jgi:metal-responsive CopG/Arc/MetJ family transcriptional regulator
MLITIAIGINMKTIQMTMEIDLLKDVDVAVKKLHTTRSAFIRKALREALGKLRTAQEESRHRRGYEHYPVEEGEFDVSENEQEWGDE